ncbi:NADAR family protein [Magnetospirillum sp. UT-4]|uniref:NADAR family protein n=1 Tax=Magnetospirillum sp. UT-4 TaxID=2681467 RepID=UPI0013854E5A|nr:NADAR family protein [Magnetospirillum sp. UT-4]CAA7625285.1 conserved hypothetical protein [Magnetospirillum sp. UT-4]
MNGDPRDFRRYKRFECAVFRKTTEMHGGLSNMAGGFPLLVEGIPVLSAEALYQACRFPHMPDVQKLILAQSSPMTAKMKSKPYRTDSRPDWEMVKVPIMKWCLRIKLAQNWDKFSHALLSTGSKAIVEDSSRDTYWGAREIGPDLLEGQNVLGRLLMELRQKLHSSPDDLREVAPVPICCFTLLERQIGVVGKRVYPSVRRTSETASEAVA